MRNVERTEPMNADTETFESLKALQELDAEIGEMRGKVASYAPLLEEVEAPVQELDAEVEALETRVREMRLDERRLERSADENRQRLEKLEDRLNQVRNVREEAAVRAEVDMVRGAVEADEHEALELLDQIRRTELKLDELREKLERARAEVEPRRRELLEERQEAADELAILEDRRRNHATRIAESARELYERIANARTGVAVAHLTADGACGHCYNMIPLQKQAEIRSADALIRCEACGVILAPPDDEP